MQQSIEAGLTTTARITVDEPRTISFMGDEGRVYATPELVRDIEITCRDLLLAHIDEGEDSVGTHIDIAHLAATPIGAWVDITVTVTAAEGRSISFDIKAHDAVEQICRGTHSRFIVDIAKTISRLQGKIDAISAV